MQHKKNQKTRKEHNNNTPQCKNIFFKYSATQADLKKHAKKLFGNNQSTIAQLTQPNEQEDKETMKEDEIYSKQSLESEESLEESNEESLDKDKVQIMKVTPGVKRRKANNSTLDNISEDGRDETPKRNSHG